MRTAPLLLLALALGCHLALPVRYAVPRPPLDGHTTFVDVPFRSGGLPLAVVIAGLVGLLVIFLDARFARNPAVLALALFPVAALLPTLVMAHLTHVRPPFRPHYLWDLAKDVPNWCFGFYFGLLALVAVDALGRWLGAGLHRLGALRPWARRAAALPMLLALVVAVAEAVRRTHDRFPAPAHFTRIGGHRDQGRWPRCSSASPGGSIRRRAPA